MTDKEVLTKAIQKAVDGGFMKGVVNNNLAGIKAVIRENSVYDIIFDHDFAKSLWGKHAFSYDVEGYNPTEMVSTILWQYHLQQMVIADDPIAYLGQHI